MTIFPGTIKAVAIATLGLSVAFSASATTEDAISNLQLKTSVEEVNGVRDIENGNYREGIAKTSATLTKTTVPALRAPLLNNLCVAHIALGEQDTAKTVCDEAVKAGSNYALAFNNRAILHYINDDVKACVEDFETAHSLARYNRLIKKNIEFIQQNNLLAKN